MPRASWSRLRATHRTARAFQLLNLCPQPAMLLAKRVFRHWRRLVVLALHTLCHVPHHRAHAEGQASAAAPKKIASIVAPFFGRGIYEAA